MMKDQRSTKQRRGRLAAYWLAAAVFGIGVTSPRAFAQGSGSVESVLPDPQQMVRVEAAVDKALEYLLKHQYPDGSWPSGKGVNNGINSLCLLAFLGRGHVPGRGPYQPVVDRAVAFILSTQRADGLYQTPNSWNGVMYEHALATLAMIESYGWISTPQMRQSVQRSVDLIVAVQSPQGGWRYQPAPNDADLSVTVMQVVALRAAQNARLTVPQETIDRARAYVKSCAAGPGFSYQPGGGPSQAQSAAGALSMVLLGGYEDPQVQTALKYLQTTDYSPGIGYFWYTNYYAMQAHFQAGGNHWQAWHPRVRKTLLEIQHDDGSWPGLSAAQYGGEAKCYSTAMGAMTLEVYMHYLPAYQR